MSGVVKRNHLRSFLNPLLTRAPSSQNRRLTALSEAHAGAAAGEPESAGSNSSLDLSAGGEVENEKDCGRDSIFIQTPKSQKSSSRASDKSVGMPISAVSGSIVGKRFYKEVWTRKADDGNGWNVMLDYRTLKTPWKRILKLPTLALAYAVAAEWDYQLKDGIRPFTMPLMKLACTALERVPFTRRSIIEGLMTKFHQDLVFSRDPDKQQTGLAERQKQKLGPLLDWVESEFGVKPIVYDSIFGGKQDENLVKAVEKLLKETNDCELAAIDAIAAGAHSLIIAIALCRGRLQIEEAINLIRIEEDLQVDKWGLVEGGHDIDIADIRVQISSAVVLLELSKI